MLKYADTRIVSKIFRSSKYIPTLEKLKVFSHDPGNYYNTSWIGQETAYFAPTVKK
jgi:hypothetical protein